MQRAFTGHDKGRSRQVASGLDEHRPVLLPHQAADADHDRGGAKLERAAQFRLTLRPGRLKDSAIGDDIDPVTRETGFVQRPARPMAHRRSPVRR